MQVNQKEPFKVGAVACYLLALNFGEPVFDFLQKRLKHWRYTIELQKQNLFLYLLFLRCTNGFIFLSTPLIFNLINWKSS